MKQTRGQSLVEFAITLPLLLLIIAGLTEVGNFIAVYNRMQAVTREAGRFGAAGGSDIIGIIEQNADSNGLSPILNISEDTARVWEVRPVIDTSTSPWSWEGATPTNPWGVTPECIFPADCTSDITISAAGVADSLETVNDASVDGTLFTVVVFEYEATSILNLDYFGFGQDGQLPLTTYAVFRQEVEQATVNRKVNGCSAYPIALNTWALPADLREGSLIGPLTLNNEEAYSTEGFSFLAWQAGNQGSNDLTNQAYGSLPFPGNSLDATYGYQEYTDPGDVSLHRGDWVTYSTASIPNANDDLKDHTDDDRALRVILYNHADISTATPNPTYTGPGGSTTATHMYRIDGFIIVKVHTHSVSNNTVTFEFIREDTSCGYAE